MGNLHELLTVEVTNDRMQAKLVCKENKWNDLKDVSISVSELTAFIKEEKVTFGLLEEQIQQSLHHLKNNNSSITIAQGMNKQNGKDGEIQYIYNSNKGVDRERHWDFRDVMRLPIVKRGEKIATLIPPTKGTNGKTVDGKDIPSKDGKPLLMRAGKNVNLNDADQSFYAKADGLVNFGMKAINVYTVYEVNEDISMKTGNVSFVGSVVIRGDVPSGFTIEASGDIKIYGIVEAATIKAGGSIYISEGIAGLKTGLLEAEEDIYVGYMNQATAKAGQNIHVEHSILHSNCNAAYDITCHRGNIIGGTLFAGYAIEAKDIGNRMNTPTMLSIGIDHHLYEQQVALEEERVQLTNNLKKMNVIKKKLTASDEEKDSKTRITLLKLEHSYNKTNETLAEVEASLQKIDMDKDELNDTDLKVFGTIYPNTVIAFGKYRRTIDKNYERVIVKMEQNDIIITNNVM